TVLALIARMLRTASSPIPAIVRSRNATTRMILARIESLDSMATILLFLSARRDESSPENYCDASKTKGTTVALTTWPRRTTELTKMHRKWGRSLRLAHESERIGEELRSAEIA